LMIKLYVWAIQFFLMNCCVVVFGIMGSLHK
jgi:hypothetical protein